MPSRMIVRFAFPIRLRMPNNEFVASRIVGSWLLEELEELEGTLMEARAPPSWRRSRAEPRVHPAPGPPRGRIWMRKNRLTCFGDTS